MERATRTVTRIGPAGSRTVSDSLAEEEPIEIRVGGEAIAVLMRTPGDDVDLVRGFALTEGMLLRPDELIDVRPTGRDPKDEGRFEMVLADGVHIDPAQFKRNLYATSSCGVCGKASIEAVMVAGRAIPPGPHIGADVVAAMPDAMRTVQTGFDRSGGIHAAALFAPDGSMLRVREDIGRHNAVDKVIGSLSADVWPLGEVILVVSGRVSFEIVQKAAVAGIPMVAGVSAASTLAAELAEELGLTVAGFVRDGSLNVYAHPRRLMPHEEP